MRLQSYSMIKSLIHQIISKQGEKYDRFYVTEDLLIRYITNKRFLLKSLMACNLIHFSLLG